MTLPETDTEFVPRPMRRRMALLALGVTLGVVSGFLWLLSILHPLPPHTITMATGPDGSAYAEFGKCYQALLAQEGIQLNLVPTAGGLDNYQRLRDSHGDVQLGFVEGGLASESTGLASLGTLDYEPLWFFVRQIDASRGFHELKTKRISLGPEGSDSRVLALIIAKLNQLDLPSMDILGLTPEASAEQLLKGRIDASAMVTSWSSPAVQRLLRSEQIDLVSFPRADAYVALFPFLNKLIIPMGVGDLAKNRPPHDVIVLATQTSLVVREDLHPALQYLLLETAAQIHSASGIFQKAGQFPAAESIDIPLSRHARHYYKSGRPFLQRYLPFWLAVLLEEILILLIPLAGVFYPLMKGVAGLYSWRMQRRIFLIYGELWWLEWELDHPIPGVTEMKILIRIKALEARANHVRVSSNFIPMIYTLKNHIELVRNRLERAVRA